MRRFSGGIPPRRKLVFCPARVDEHKGIREFVQAAAILDQRFPGDLFFAVAGGSGDLLPELAALAKKHNVTNIRFGHPSESRDLSPMEMPTLFRRAIACALPSRTENYPIVLLEAQAFGCPVVAAAVGGVPEIIDPRRTGLLFEPGKADELADRLSAMIRNDRKRKRICQEAAAGVRRRNHASRMAAEYKDLYLALAGIRLKN